MNDQETYAELARIRQLPEVQNWTRGDEYPDIDLPKGYGFTYNVLSGRLVIMREAYIGMPSCDPRYETYHCM